MRILGILVGVVLLIGLGWVAYWWAGASGQEVALSRWFQERSTAGWQAEHQGIEVTGFPSDFRRQVMAPRLADPQAGWAWQAPWIRADSKVWQPTKFDVSLPPEQSIAAPGQRVAVTSQALDAVFHVKPGLSLALTEVALSAADLRLAGQAGWQGAADRLHGQLIERAQGAPPNTYALDATADTVLLPRELLQQIGIAGVLQEKVEVVRVDGYATLTRPLDRTTVEEGDLNAQTLVLRDGEVVWGDMALRASGRLDADTAGYPVGEIQLALRNWRRMLATAQQAGALRPEVANAVETALGLLSLFGNPETIDVTLGFGDGRVRIGPVTIGEAPRIADP